MSRSHATLLLLGLFVFALSVPVENDEQPVRPVDFQNQPGEHDPTQAEEVQTALQGVEVLIFKAKWCGPCNSAQMQRLPGELRDRDIKVRVIDIDEHPELAAHYGVTSIPHTIVLQDGTVMDQKTGVVDVVLILRVIASFLKHVIPWILEFWGL